MNDKQIKAVAELLWDYLQKDPEHKDRRRTAYGTKTKQGLALSVSRAIEENADTVPAAEAGLVEAELKAAKAFNMVEEAPGLYRDPADGTLNTFNRETRMMEEIPEATNPLHPFNPHPKYPLACVECGKAPGHWSHE